MKIDPKLRIECADLSMRAKALGVSPELAMGLPRCLRHNAPLLDIFYGAVTGRWVIRATCGCGTGEFRSLADAVADWRAQQEVVLAARRASA